MPTRRSMSAPARRRRSECAQIPTASPFSSSRATPASRRDGLAIGGLPAPSAGAVAALDHALLVNLRDDLTVAGEQRFGRAHLSTQRQLAFGETVGPVFRKLGLGAVRLRTTGAVRALVHFPARAEIADFWILWRTEGACVEAIAAADAEVLRVQDHRIGGRVEAVHGTDRRARRVRAMHAGHRDRTLPRLAVVDGNDAATVDAPRHLVLVLAGGDARVALDATVGVAEKFHPSHVSRLPYAALT